MLLIIFLIWLAGVLPALFVGMRHIAAVQMNKQDGQEESEEDRKELDDMFMACILFALIWPISSVIAFGMASGMKSEVKKKSLRKQLADEQERNRQLTAQVEQEAAAKQATLNGIIAEHGWDTPGLSK